MRILLAWTILSLVPAVIAWEKNRSPLLFFTLSMMFSPLVGFIAAILIPKKDPAAHPHSVTYRNCARCGAQVRVPVTTCPSCGADLPIIEAELLPADESESRP